MENRNRARQTNHFRTTQIADVLDAAHQQKVCLDNTEITFSML
jgi:hypothetical protein